MSSNVLPLENINSAFFPVANNIKLDSTHYEKKIVNAKKENPLHWHIVAIAVGIVVFGVGCFGILGLLNSYSVVSLPQAFSSFIGTIGNTSHFWSLWTISAGGITIGSLVIAFSSIKLHSVQSKRKEVLEPIYANLKLYQEGMNVFWNCFSDEENSEVKLPDYVDLSNGRYVEWEVTQGNADPFYVYFIRKDYKTYCTPKLSPEHRSLMKRFFTGCATGYNPI